MLTNIVGDIHRHMAYFGTVPKLVIGKFTLEVIRKEFGDLILDADINNQRQQTISGCEFEEGDFWWGYYLKKLTP
jgi:hypothetical protein